MSEPVFDLSENPVHLGLGATATVLSTFTGEPSWYQAYGDAHAADGAEGRLVALHTFDDDWGQWEMHPNGDELVLCITGRVRLHQEFLDGTTREATIGPGQAIINDSGVWHTADVVDGPAQLLFVTAGMGTEGRPR